MDHGPSRATEVESNTSIVDKGWNLVSHNTELLIFIIVGFVGILAETVGYRPLFRLNDLLPPLSEFENYNGNISTEGNRTEKADIMNLFFIHKMSEGLDTVRAYTVHVTLATYILLPYPVITEKQKMLLAPWLIVSFFRSVLRELVITLVGILLCASHEVFFYPCVQYSALQGAQFCFIFYFWTSVHSFYHYLDKKNTTEGRVSSVINSIKQTHSFFDTATPNLLMQQSVDEMLSMDLDEDDDSLEATLMERAALAWIIREILENDENFVTDKQFSQHLIVKATLELHQALRELAEKRKLTRKARKKPSPKQKIEESLEFMKCPAVKSPPGSIRQRIPSRHQAFEINENLSIRDPIRKIRPLTYKGKPFIVDARTSQISRPSVQTLLTNISGLSEDTIASVSTQDSGSQTEPPTHQMSRLLDILEFQQQQRLKNSEANRRDSFWF